MTNRIFFLLFLLFVISSCKKDCYLCEADCIHIYGDFKYCDNDFEDYNKYIEFADSVVSNLDVLAYRFFTNNLSFCNDDEKLDKLIDRGMRCQKY